MAKQKTTAKASTPTYKQAVDECKKILGPATKTHSPLGHKLNTDAGKIDMAIFGGATTIEEIAKVVGTSNTSKKTKTSPTARVRRVDDHVVFNGRTAGKKGKGVDTRMKNVHGDKAHEKGKEIAPYLAVIAGILHGQFKSIMAKKKADAKSAQPTGTAAAPAKA